MNLEFLEDLIQALKTPPELRSIQDINLIEKLVRRVDFFKQIQDEQSNPQIFAELSSHLEHDYAGPNTVLYDVDTIGDKFYVILTGEVGVYTKSDNMNEEIKSTSVKLLNKVKARFKKSQNNNKYKEYLILNLQTNLPRPQGEEELVLVNTLKEGQSFGELALINNKPRMSTIVALAPTHLAILRKQNFKKILKASQEQKLLKEMGFFAQLSLFEHWHINLIRHIYLNSNVIQCRLGQYLYHQGDEASEFFIIKSGFFDIQIVTKDEGTTLDQELEVKNKDIQKYFLRRQTKSFIRKLGTVTTQQILALDDMNSPNQKYRFTCVCSSASGEAISISKQLYDTKIHNQHSSKHFVNELYTIQKEFWDNRVQQVCKQLDSFRQQMDQQARSTTLEDDQKIFIIHNHDNLLEQTLDYNNITTLKPKRELSQHSNKTHLNNNKSSIIHNQSFLNRAKDRSLMGKVQTQQLYRRQAYKKLVKDLNTNTIDSNQQMTTERNISIQFNHKQKLIDKQKSRVPIRSSILNDKEIRIINQVLNIGKRESKKHQILRTNSNVDKAKLTPFLQRKLKEQESKVHLRARSVFP